MKNCKVVKTWKSKDGRRIRICDMSNQHLVNTMKLLERNASAERFNNFPYPSFQGEMAQYYAEQEFDNLIEKEDYELAGEMYPIYKDMYEELLKRGLDNKPQD